jgi:hypothetical protein
VKAITKIAKHSEEEVAKLNNKNAFMDAYIELHKETIKMLWQIIDLKYCNENDDPITIDRDNAVIGGNLLRLNKLNLSFLENFCNNKLEICSIINRCLAETAINLKYLLLDDNNQIRNYIKNSLITEKELWGVIKSNIEERGEEASGIETRMQNSILKSFEQSDFELDDVNRSSGWKTFRSRADKVSIDMFYSVYYGMSSHAIHGNWQDILSNNLKKVEGGFKLDLNWQKTGPQIIDGPIILSLDVMSIFIKKELSSDNNSTLLLDNIKTLLDYQSSLMSAHEKWMLNK